MASGRWVIWTITSVCLLTVAALPATAQFTYSEKPSLEKVPAGTITGQANGKPFEAKFVAFQPSYTGNWEMIIADKPFEPADIIMDCQHIDIDLPHAPAAGKVMSKPMEYGKGIWQIQSPDDPAETTSWNADNAWVLEITEWNVKPWDPNADMFQQAGTASGRIGICYKGSGSFKNSWAGGTFKNASVRFMGEPPAAIKNAMASAPAAPAANAAAGSTKTIPGSATAGTWKLVGNPGDWAGTIAATTLDGKVFTIESGGALFSTDPATGKWTPLGKPDFAATRFMFTAGKQLYTIEESGSLYQVNPGTGAWKQIGKPNDWKNTIAIASGAGKLYSIEATGALFVTDPATGIWKSIGKPDFAATRFMLFSKGSLFTIETSGTMYKVNPADGSWASVGHAGAFSETKVLTVLNDTMYTTEEDGSLVQCNPETGTRTVIGKPEFINTLFLLPVGTGLTSIESSGSMYAIHVQ